MPLDNFMCLKQQTNKPSPKQKQIQGYAVGIKILLRICWYFKAWLELGKKKIDLITKPQTGWGWKGLLEVIWSSCPAQEGHLELDCPGPCPHTFEYLQWWRPHTFSGWAVTGLCHPHSKKVFPDVQMDLPMCLSKQRKPNQTNTHQKKNLLLKWWKCHEKKPTHTPLRGLKNIECPF